MPISYPVYNPTTFYIPGVSFQFAEVWASVRLSTWQQKIIIELKDDISLLLRSTLVYNTLSLHNGQHKRRRLGN